MLSQRCINFAALNTYKVNFIPFSRSLRLQFAALAGRFHPAIVLLTGLLAFHGGQQAAAQLVVDPSLTAIELAEKLAGTGVTISGVTLDCPGNAYGSFDGTASYLPLDSGIILASGLITNAIGPNDLSGAGTDMFWPGDPDLDALPAVSSTNDACVLEFDVTVTADTLKFNYIFGSEEYIEFVGTAYNDVFAFWISGPGIPTPVNMATIPGTAIPVTINNVNPTSFSTYYVNNGTGFSAPFSVDPGYIQYDGMTVVLEARSVVIPCETYHLKLAVADEFDGILDSGVFIEAGSLSSTGVSLSSRTSVGFGFENAIEGCVDGIITFTPDRIPDDTTVIHFGIGGTATNGIDYVNIPDSIVFFPGMTERDVYVVPILDPLPEGSETVVIFLTDPCTGLPRDSAVMIIQDGIFLEATTLPDEVVCPGDTVHLYATGGIGYSWDPVASWPGADTSETVIYPLVSNWYTVSTNVGSCFKEDSVFVEVSVPPTANAGSDIDLCLGSTVNLNGSGSISFSWSPPTFLDDPTLPDPLCSADTDISYTLTVFDAAGCSDSDMVAITIRPRPLALVDPADAFLCPGEPFSLSASGGLVYTWSPSTGLDNPFIDSPTLTAFVDETYSVVVQDVYGCADTATVDIRVDVFPTVEAGEESIIDLGQSITLNGSSTDSYIWSPAETLDDPLLLSPLATPDISTWYVLTATSAAGCVTADSVYILVIEPPSVIIPTAFTPNGDGIHDVLHPVVVREYGDIDPEFRIMNRWGETVFQSFDVYEGWDGTYLGKDQEIGAYIYIFVGNDRRGEPFTLTGTITLLR